jgi:hypothetical protein
MIKNIAIAILGILGWLSIGSYFAWYYPAELLSHFRYQYLVIALLSPVYPSCWLTQCPAWFWDFAQLAIPDDL